MWRQEFQSTHPRGVRPPVGGGAPVSGKFQSTHPRGVRPNDTALGTGTNWVSIHAPAWGATKRPPCCAPRTTCFNPRTRVGCDLLADITFGMDTAFQSTHPRGVRPTCSGTGCMSISFQSTHPRGVRPLVSLALLIHRRFNPRTRVGCDTALPIFWPISRRFQSTHPRGVRPSCPNSLIRAMKSFNPRTRVGCDKPGRGGRILQDSVSIHAPAWGATWYTSQTSSPLLSFNPRTRVGCDDASWSSSVYGKSFQSTHPRGVRRRQLTRRGASRHVSIHAPAWGATRTTVRHYHKGNVSIHAPAWGATRLANVGMMLHGRFNPRTRVGCDRAANKAKIDAGAFQSTHPRGVRLFPCFIQ